MVTTVDKIYEQAMSLSDESKALLAERLVQYLESRTRSELESIHLDIVKRRREEMRDRKVQPIDGHDGLAMAHRIVNP